MACAKIARGDQFSCGPCRLQWDRNDVAPPCGRDGGPGKDVILSESEVKALRLCEADWQPLKTGGCGRRRGKVRISFSDAATLTALHLCFRAKNSGALRATPYGSAWLDRNTKRKRSSP